ncbi:YggT family protein [Acidaminobacterium chupaoyuni]
MNGIYYVFSTVAYSLITFIEIAMLVRAVMSWFPQTQGSKIYEIAYMITEPVIMPFRALVDKIPALRGFPLDISFLLAYMVLIMLETIL